MKLAWRLALLTLIGTHTAWCIAEQRSPAARAQSSYYIELYGLAAPDESPLVQRAANIFSRVNSVSETPHGLTTALKVINSNGAPWAIALPDGNIVLSKGALDVCYDGVSLELGDARIAFVIGHELAHLKSNDFWHQEIYLSLAGGDKQPSLKSAKDLISAAAGIATGNNNEWQSVIKRKELQADDAGFLFASLAGYRTDLVIPESDEDSFLQHWVKQTRTVSDELHLAPDERTSFLANRFKSISEKTEFFRYGIKLAHFGQYEDAIYFFKEYQRAFPAHEVLNNLGYAHLQLAYKYMPESLQVRYWLPTTLENTPALFSHNRGISDASLSLDVKKNLQKSIHFLKQAVNIRNDQIDSFINLATSYFYAGEYFKARAAIEDALKIDKDSSSAQQLRALIIYEQEKDIDMWPMATKILESIKAAGNPAADFNLARLLYDRGRLGPAQDIWLSLVSTNTNLPPRYRLEICRTLNDKLANKHCDVQANPKKDIPLRLLENQPSFLGIDISDTDFRKHLSDADWQHYHREFAPFPLDVFSNKNGDSILAVDYTVTLKTIRNSSLKNKQELLACCGPPVTVHSLGQSEIWSYGPQWSVLMSDDIVNEIWVSNAQSVSKQ